MSTNKNFDFRDYLNNCDYMGDVGRPMLTNRIETRTRQYDVTDALRFRVHDPLWMLARQWQMGEFRGNDAGTAMSVRCKVRYTPIEGYDLGKDGKRRLSLSKDEPIEPLVERIDREITPEVRVESAVYFIDLLYSLADIGGVDVPKLVRSLVGNSKLALDGKGLSMARSSVGDPGVQAFTESKNTRLAKFKASCVGKVFDGYKLYLLMQRRTFQQSDLFPELGLKPSGSNMYRGTRSVALEQDALTKALGKVLNRYDTWFKERYLPNTQAESAWDTQSLSHHFKAWNAIGQYAAEDYAGGRVSWYSFDMEARKDRRIGRFENREIDVLPTLATYPGAPNKRLWQFEDRKVFMGNSTGLQAKGNIAFLQYATMYANDWMLFPLQTEFGQFLEVYGITVYDSFGIPVTIKEQAGSKDEKPATFGQKWQMFTNAPVRQESPDAKSAPGLLFPPTFARTLEGAPIEEVSFLRDEMANMLWGVETRLDDGCGSSLDASLLASDVSQYVEESYQEEVEKAQLSVSLGKKKETVVESTRKADVKYTLMTNVPFNWIPFIPQHIKTPEEQKLYEGLLGGREVIFRRGKIPCYVVGPNRLGGYYPVRPMSSILKVNSCKASDGTAGEEPLFIEEEQVQGVGTLIVKNCQRSRWIGGKTYTWMGYSKQIKHTQGVSGLEFDTLRDSAEK